MPARSVTALPSSGARPVLFEQKADGFRALVFTGPKPYLQTRGADLGPAFPGITRAAAPLGVEAVVDAELVVWHKGRLDFTALQHRAGLRGARAERASREQPAHLITFELLELSGSVLTDQLLHRRRSALENLFASLGLGAPWALCPADRRCRDGPQQAGPGVGSGRRRGLDDQGIRLPVPSRSARVAQVEDAHVGGRDHRRVWIWWPIWTKRRRRTGVPMPWRRRRASCTGKASRATT
ncbi:hypothetical protein ACIRO3_23530 [Streptomyces sp. NPDC102278]|uniref:ATP-dependent DNA ligase n=1 Tax=Streptomyces sp. NPDC102278 TaxID=3366152 RepID=UPI0037F13985